MLCVGRPRTGRCLPPPSGRAEGSGEGVRRWPGNNSFLRDPAGQTVEGGGERTVWVLHGTGFGGKGPARRQSPRPRVGAGCRLGPPRRPSGGSRPRRGGLRSRGGSPSRRVLTGAHCHARPCGHPPCHCRGGFSGGFWLPGSPQKMTAGLRKRGLFFPPPLLEWRWRFFCYFGLLMVVFQFSPDEDDLHAMCVHTRCFSERLCQRPYLKTALNHYL